MAGYLYGANSTPTKTTITSTSTASPITSTITVTVGSISSAKSFTGSQGRVTFSRTNGDWDFTMILNGTAVNRGQVMAALLNLTNISGQTQTVHVVVPLYNPLVYSQNGTVVWRAYPSEMNFDMNWTSGPGRSYEWDIPTSSLHSGQTYVLNVWPFIGTPSSSQYLIGEDLMINATFTVL